MKIKNLAAELLATFFYIGRIKYAPGTFGSIAALPIYYWLNTLIDYNYKPLFYAEQKIIEVATLSLVISVILFFVGILATSIYLGENTDQDPKEVVIDEVVGQLLTLGFSSFAALLLAVKLPYLHWIIIYYIIPLVLFRVYDIMKPWPISWVDQKIKGAIGVMLDDVLAACFAVIVYYIIALVI